MAASRNQGRQAALTIPTREATMPAFDVSRHQTGWTREQTETSIAGFSIVLILGLLLVGLIMAAPLLQ